MHWALRASLCLFMLSGTNILLAQDDISAEEEMLEDTVQKKVKKVVLPTYEMKSVSGKIYDAATGEAMAGVRVQALSNRHDRRKRCLYHLRSQVRYRIIYIGIGLQRNANSHKRRNGTGRQTVYHPL